MLSFSTSKANPFVLKIKITPHMHNLYVYIHPFNFIHVSVSGMGENERHLKMLNTL